MINKKGDNKGDKKKQKGDNLRGSCVSYDNAWYKTLVLETSAAHF